jgi:hypothetical protein
MTLTITCNREGCLQDPLIDMIWRVQIGKVIETGEPHFSPAVRGLYCAPHAQQIREHERFQVFKEERLSKARRRRLQGFAAGRLGMN